MNEHTQYSHVNMYMVFVSVISAHMTHMYLCVFVGTASSMSKQNDTQHALLFIQQVSCTHVVQSDINRQAHHG